MISTRSMSSRDSLDLANAKVVAGMGAVNMMTGSLAATAKVWNRARGRRPRWTARSSDMISAAAAPSEIWEEVAAVTTPSATKPGGSDARFS